MVKFNKKYSKKNKKFKKLKIRNKTRKRKRLKRIKKGGSIRICKRSKPTNTLDIFNDSLFIPNERPKPQHIEHSIKKYNFVYNTIQAELKKQIGDHADGFKRPASYYTKWKFAVGERLEFMKHILTEFMKNPYDPSDKIEMSRYSIFDDKQNFETSYLNLTLNLSSTDYDVNIETEYFKFEDGVGKSAIADFANKYLGGNFLGKGFVQEEKMFWEAPILTAIQYLQYIKEKPIVLDNYDVLLIKNVKPLFNINFYETFPDNDWYQKTNSREGDIPTCNVIAFDCKKIEKQDPKNPKPVNYTREEVIWHIGKFLSVMLCLIKNDITTFHSGGAGAGVFGHELNASLLLQIIANIIANRIEEELDKSKLTIIFHTKINDSKKRDIITSITTALKQIIPPDVDITIENIIKNSINFFIDTKDNFFKTKGRK